MIRRPPRSTRVRSSAASDVYKRQVVSRLDGGAHEKEEGDFLLLLLLSALGASVLASAGNLLVLFLGLEITIIPTYALVAFRTEEDRSYEAGLKYFVLS